MTAPGNDLVQVLLAISFCIAFCYALGRIHQWYRDGAEREQAYRQGYDLASDSMFEMARSGPSAAFAALSVPADVMTWRPDAGQYGEPQPEEAGRRPPLRRSVGDSRRRIPLVGGDTWRHLRS
jgi:hypothetical protein